MKVSKFEHLVYDLSPTLVALEKGGQIKFPCDVALSATDGEMLGSYEVDGSYRFSLVSEDQHIDNAIFPLTIIISDAQGRSLELSWSPPSIH